MDRCNQVEKKMVNAISGAANMLSALNNQPQRRQPPPPEQDAFQVADTNQDGVVSAEELEALAGAVSELRETDISQDQLLANFDRDSDGGLSGEELLDMLSNYGIAPPEIASAQENSEAMQPTSELFTRALEAYALHSGKDSISQLIEILQKGTAEQDGTITPIDVKA